MSARKDNCAGCWTPLVDETIKGDIVERAFTVVYPEQRLNGRTNENFSKVVVGSNNGCRNCVVILDALSFLFKSKDQKKFEFTIAALRQNPILSIKCSVDMDFRDFKGGRHLEPTHMEVFRQTGMSG
jgi:hypothetical protein